MAYADLGDGPAVVLLHGFPTSSHLWRRDAPLLASRMRVVVPDLLGHGASIVDPGADLSVAGQAEAVRALLDMLGVGEFAVAGHGLGGAVAWELARDPGARALVLIDAEGLDGRPPATAATALAGADGAAAAADVPAAARRILEAALARSPASAETLDPYVAPWTVDPVRLTAAAAALARPAPPADPAGLEPALPAFVLWGEEDRFAPPAEAERLGEALDGATVALLPGCGHLLPEDAPETAGPLVYRWLRTRYLADLPSADAPVPVFLHRPTDEELAAFGARDDWFEPAGGDA